MSASAGEPARHDTRRQTLLIGCAANPPVAPTPETFGRKACNLWRMERAGLRVPPAFVLETGYCHDYLASGRSVPTGLRDLLAARVRDLERASGLALGSTRRPLLLSVRSGAKVSMPGMMETVLDVGIGEATVSGLLRLTGNPRLVWDSYRRLVQSFAEVVHGLPARQFEEAHSARLREAGAATLRNLDFQGLRALTRDYLELFEALAQRPFPQSPLEQLEAAVVAVWASWDGAKARQYRQLQGIADDAGTSVTVQQMVFGNAGGTSGSGVAFTRDPGSGERALYVDFMFNAQGEDVVSGRHRTPDGERFAAVLPQVHAHLRGIGERLEREFGDLQEFEFTVQEGQLYLLQTRTGKRTPWAAVRVAVEQVDEGLVGADAALDRLKGIDLDRVERTRLMRGGATRVLGHAVPAGGGVAVGEIAFDVERARNIVAAGRAAILVRENMATEDIAGIAMAAGILTASGGRTSHAAVVARQLDKVCLVGCTGLVVDLEHRRCTLGGERLDEGAVISLDGHAGQVLAGAVDVEIERPVEYLRRITRWRGVAQGA
jgi:pyruvate,orthophosphate dikinase